MADRGFLISDDLESIGVSLNIPAVLNSRDQLTKAEIKESQAIASVRIHVERTMQLAEKFCQIRNEIQWNLSKVDTIGAKKNCQL